MKTVIIEDLISTGGSSLRAYEALKDAGLEIAGMLAIFTYGFPVAGENFKKAGCPLTTLGDYESLLELALQTSHITLSQHALLKRWREKPDEYQG
jgi:orotate phosphoribosyltransferase